MDIQIKGVSKKKSGGAKKLGRNAKKCTAYRQAGTREKNKARRLLKAFKREARLQRLREKRARKVA